MASFYLKIYESETDNGGVKGPEVKQDKLVEFEEIAPYRVTSMAGYIRLRYTRGIRGHIPQRS